MTTDSATTAAIAKAVDALIAARAAALSRSDPFDPILVALNRAADSLSTADGLNRFAAANPPATTNPADQ